MMEIIKRVLILTSLALLIWINIPPIQFANPLSKKQIIKTTPFSIDTYLFGAHVQKKFDLHYGLDLQGGVHLVFEADTTKVPVQDVQDALISSRDIIERRVNFFGVSEPSIQTVRAGDKYRITVDLPGVSDTSQAISLIGQTAQLSFREELKNLDPQLATIAAQQLLFSPQAKLTGKHIKKAIVSFDPNTGKPQVSLVFTSEGAKLFADLTRQNIGRPIAIALDESIISAPTVQQAILDGNAVITGNFTTEDAKQLAIAINSGALPLPVKLIEQKSIGATLGESQIRKSVWAGIIGLAAVMLFMTLYYRRLGVIACAGLIIYGLLSLTLFKAIPVTLTLSGVAGFILSIGMAVDSNILIFERIREEKRKGKDHEVAIRLGLTRAIDAIKDANFTTLLVAFILFNPLNWQFLPQFGLVRGFALTLAIGVLMSLFTGVVITKRLLNIFYKS